MTVVAHLRPLPRLRGHGGAALAAETVGTAKGGELPGAASEAKALLVPATISWRRGAIIVVSASSPRFEQIAGQPLPLVKTLERGVSQRCGQTRFTALWHLTLLIEQYQMIAPQHEPAGLFG